MNRKRFFLIYLVVILLLVLVAVAGLLTAVPKAFSAPPAEEQKSVQAQEGENEEVVLSYSAKFVCTAPQPAGMPYYGSTPPVVHQTTEILVHNPNDHAVVISKAAYIALVEPPIQEIFEPMDMILYGPIPAGASFSIDCSDIAGHLLSQEFQVGTTYEGFVTIAIGPHQLYDEVLYPQLEVTAEYTRGSDTLIKDIHYQPWWTYWPWDFEDGIFPFQLGFPYTRIITLTTTYYPDLYYCKPELLDKVSRDVIDAITDLTLRDEILDALEVGYTDYFGGDYPGMQPNVLPPEDPDPALIAVIGRCEVIIDGGIRYMEVAYVMVSNQAPPGSPIYPWIPGRWYDLPVVFPTNMTTDLDYLFNYWHAQMWSDYIGNTYTPEELMPKLDYFFPYWSGWSGWWWDYNGTDSIDVGFGQGESIDVEQIMPSRLVRSWQVIDITPE